MLHRPMKIALGWILSVAAALELALLSLARVIGLADMAPPASSPDSNPLSGEPLTQVRMVSETVTLDVQKNSVSKWLGQAKVTSDSTPIFIGSPPARMPSLSCSGRCLN